MVSCFLWLRRCLLISKTQNMPYRFSTKYVSAVPINSFSRWTSSLYTPSFLIAMASKLLKFFLNKRTILEPSTTTLIRLAELVLTLNNFSFDGEHYQQISGVAMGTKMGPSYANLFVGYVEQQIFERYTGPIPDFFGRYIDDCLGTASCTRVDLKRFINYVNGFHHAPKFTWEISETCESFLDISVSINGDALATSVSYKPTHSHSYLLFSSSHPNHTKQSIPYSQFLRLRRLCSDDKDFETKSLEMRTFFVERGYPTHLLDSAIQKAFNNSHRDTLNHLWPKFLMIKSL